MAKAHLCRFIGLSLCVVTFSMLLVTAGCHTAYSCPILQPMTGGNIPAPLPPQPNDPSDCGSAAPGRWYVGAIATCPDPQGDAYKVIGYRQGIRFYIVKYNDKLYRGGDIRSAEGAKALRALGIKTVVSVTPDDAERKLCKEFNFKLVEIPFGFNGLEKSDLDKFLAAVDSSPTPIYVHDFSGEPRAGILLAYYRIKKEGWSYDRAINEYWRLDANYWDSAGMVGVLKRSVGR